MTQTDVATANHSIQTVSGPRPALETGVRLRKFPYPYHAALAIASDIDNTRTNQEFLEIQRFLNTGQQTSMGRGVGLEIGNSFFFYDQRLDFSYFGHEGDASRRIILDLMRSGHLDCLHSYGDTVSSRDQIVRALDELNGAGVRLDVWINHHGSLSDIGRKFEYFFGRCLGDDPQSTVYHTDLTIDFGVRFAWVGASSRIVGQSATQRAGLLLSLIDARHPLSSAKNVLKEVRKAALGRLKRDERFLLAARNELMAPFQLRDGRSVHEFMRYCNHPVSVALGATSRGLAYSISPRALRQLVRRGGFSIVYTHLGKNEGLPQLIAPETQAALRRLEREHREGRILVLTTSRLLNYYRSTAYLQWSSTSADGETHIVLERIADPIFGEEAPDVRQVQGITFYVSRAARTRLFLPGREVSELQRNPADASGQESVTVPFSALQFPY